jgi:predicted permease
MSMWSRVRNVFRRDLNEEIDAELASHLDEAQAAGRELLAVKRTMGSRLKGREAVRDAIVAVWLESLVQDVRYAMRGLRRSPGFATTAIVTLGLGIGANTAIFSLLNPVLFRPLHASEPDRLVRIFSGRSGADVFGPVSYPNYVDLRDRAQSFSTLAAYSWPVPFRTRTESAEGDASRTERVWGLVVSGNYFDVFGASMALGRSFRADEDEAPNAQPVVVISDRLWRSKFLADPQIVGRLIRLNNQPFTIIGVAPPRVPQPELLFAADLWVPMMMQQQAMPGQRTKLTSRKETWLSVMGRLKPGVSLGGAQAEVETWGHRLEAQYPDQNPQLVLSLLSEVQGRTAGQAQTVAQAGWGLLAVMGIILLIACANIVSLLLARSLVRQTEFAIRVSLGAGRRRVMSQMITENLVMSLLGGVVGLGVAIAGVRGLLRMTPPAFPYDIWLDTGVDARVLTFIFALSVLTGLALAIVPAMRVWAPDVASVLKSRDPITARGRRSLVTRDVLVVSQVAISFVLVVLAGLFIRSRLNAERIDLGFQPENRLVATVTTIGYRPRDGVAFQSSVRRDIKSIPGVVDVSFTAHAPLGPGYLGDGHVYIAGEPPMNDGRRPAIYYDKVGPEYFRTMGTSLIAGRDFSDQDRPESPLVAVVNVTFARAFWPSGSAVGKYFRLNTPDSSPIQVIGVVRDGKYQTLGELPERHIFLAALQDYQVSVTMIVHTADDPTRYADTVRHAVQRRDSNLAVTDIRTLQQHLGFVMYPARMSALLMTMLGALGLLLATVGFYGLLAFVVRQRVHEFGIRMALGAQPQDLVRLVMGHGAVILGVGFSVGLASALALSHVLAAVFYDVNPSDPATILASVCVFAGAVLPALCLPALYASRVAPMTALRQS